MYHCTSSIASAAADGQAGDDGTAVVVRTAN